MSNNCLLVSAKDFSDEKAKTGKILVDANSDRRYAGIMEQDQAIMKTNRDLIGHVKAVLAESTGVDETHVLIVALAAALDWEVQPYYESKVLIPNPGVWWANDGNAVIAEEHDDGLEAAQSYVDGGDFRPDDGDSTIWVKVHVWRDAIDLNGDDIRVDEATHKIAVDPEEPECTADEHDWQAPREIVGGCEENPGVWGSGGSVACTEVCMHCGCKKVEDHWAQDPNDGEQGLDSVYYAPGHYATEVQTYLVEQVTFELAPSTNADQCLIVATLGEESATYVVAADEHDSDNGWSDTDTDTWPGPTDTYWPEPPDALISEAREQAKLVGIGELEEI